MCGIKGCIQRQDGVDAGIVGFFLSGGIDCFIGAARDSERCTLCTSASQPNLDTNGRRRALLLAQQREHRMDRLEAKA